MLTLMTVIRKRAEISTDDFRNFMEFEYGPTYVAMPQTREYIHYYLLDMMSDATEPPIDAIVKISFESEEEMRTALQSDGYKKAHAERQKYIQSTSVGIHSAVVEKVVSFV